MPVVTAVHPLIAGRTSPRAFDSSHTLSDADLQSLLEAARWAASSMNRQQWGFLVGQRDDATFKSIFDSLVPGNQIWAGNASVLIAAVARVRNDDQTPDKFGPFELGLSVANLVLQAESLGLVAHQMGGLNPAAIREAFSITPEWDVFSVSAIGTRGDVSELPDALAEREIAPRVRNLISAVAFAGKWQTPAFDH